MVPGCQFILSNRWTSIKNNQNGIIQSSRSSHRIHFRMFVDGVSQWIEHLHFHMIIPFLIIKLIDIIYAESNS